MTLLSLSLIIAHRSSCPCLLAVGVPMTVQSTASFRIEPELKSALQASLLHWSPPLNMAHFLQEIKEALTGSSGNAETIGHWIINRRIKWLNPVKKKI